MATWTFAPNGDGEEHGFHNPGVETFKANLERYLAREALQNSLDARKDESKPVYVHFRLLQLAHADVPGMDALATTFRQCSAHWTNDKKAKAFFDRALGLARGKQVSCLQIGDTNTTGVPGSDNDKDQGWFTLVRSSGASAKGGGEGGSFGLGKHAPFAASRLRTVFYSTITDANLSAFQGVSRLVTHVGARGRLCQPTGFLGGPNGCSIRNKRDIPKLFRRTEAGTDIYVLGYHAETEWQDQVIYEVLDSFWPAVHRNDLVVSVGDTTVSKKTLRGLLEKFAENDKDFHASLYYAAYTRGTSEIEEVLPTLGKAAVRMLVGDSSDSNLPNHVAMIRRTGMVIYHRRSRSNVPFCGVFECRNEKGNQKLRDMEPPRHDDWNGNLPEKGENVATKKELDEFIIKCVKSLAPVSTEQTVIIPDLSQYLPDDSDTPEDGFDGKPTDSDGKHESFDRTPKKQAISGRPLGRKPATQPGNKSLGDGDEDAGGGEGETGGPPNSGDGGDRGSEGSAEDGSGGDSGDGGRVPVIVKSRAFLRDAAAGVYSLTVHAPKPLPSGDVYLSVAAVGDDAVPIPVRVKAAGVEGGRGLDVPKLGSIGPVKFPRTGPLRVLATLDQPRRLALDISAYEVTAHEAE